MNFPILTTLFLCMTAFVSPFAWSAPFLADADRSEACPAEQSQMQSSRAEDILHGFPIILAGVGRDQCWARCDGDLQSCVNNCPGFDESNVVDPKYAARKCKNACDAVLSQCKSACPAD